jgi:hypothetical protein
VTPGKAVGTSDGVIASLAGRPETPMVFLVVVGGEDERGLADAERVLGRVTPPADAWSVFDGTRAVIAGAQREIVGVAAQRADGVFAYCVACVAVEGAQLFVIAGCSAGLMARPSCAQVLAYGTLGEVAASLRIGDAA